MQVQNVTAKYIMKCDDDTFVRIDSVLEEIRTTSISQGLYMGSMNEFHRPLRSGKWAVTAEVFLFLFLAFVGNVRETKMNIITMLFFIARIYLMLLRNLW